MKLIFFLTVSHPNALRFSCEQKLDLFYKTTMYVSLSVFRHAMPVKGLYPLSSSQYYQHCMDWCCYCPYCGAGYIINPYMELGESQETLNCRVHNSTTCARPLMKVVELGLTLSLLAPTTMGARINP